ncbi:hypothetical protein KM043_005945 [Ampulex compressa]|nr:hypothetical protein KM043_005945 [Ampulex compressa]
MLDRRRQRTILGKPGATIVDDSGGGFDDRSRLEERGQVGDDPRLLLLDWREEEGGEGGSSKRLRGERVAAPRVTRLGRLARTWGSLDCLRSRGWATRASRALGPIKLVKWINYGPRPEQRAGEETTPAYTEATTPLDLGHLRESLMLATERERVCLRRVPPRIARLISAKRRVAKPPRQLRDLDRELLNSTAKIRGPKFCQLASFHVVILFDEEFDSERRECLVVPTDRCNVIDVRFLIGARRIPSFSIIIGNPGRNSGDVRN